MTIEGGPLDPVEARVLGCLLEKQLTVPATYPLTPNALVAACNQSSGRDPVMTVTDGEVERAVDSLKTRRLVRRVLPSHGARVSKIRQVADEQIGLDEGDRALLALLLLRGPQTAAELRSRGERLHAFDDVAETEAFLTALADRREPLAVRLSRRPGERGERWAQLLTDAPTTDPTPSVAAPGPASTVALRPADVDLSRTGPLAPLVGTWVGTGRGHYPTIEAFAWTERITIGPVPGKPLLAYRSATTATDDGRTLHGESGFFRPVGPAGVELVVVAGPGLVEVCEGTVEADGLAVTLELESTTVAGTATAKAVTATARTYRVDGEDLVYDLSMAAVGQPLTHHLRATLRRR